MSSHLHPDGDLPEVPDRQEDVQETGDDVSQGEVVLLPAPAGPRHGTARNGQVVVTLLGMGKADKVVVTDYRCQYKS